MDTLLRYHAKPGTTATVPDLHTIQFEARCIADAAGEARALRVHGIDPAQHITFARDAFHKLATAMGYRLPEPATNSLPSERSLSADDRADRDYQQAREERS